MSRFTLPLRAAMPTLAFATLFVGACGTDPPLAPAFKFNRPELVELVCINPKGSSESPAADADGGMEKPAPPLVLPLRCCAAATPLNPELEDDNTKGCGGAGSLHALVTQSTRGEVAAVDLVGRKVIDSDQRIPGYTFVDVGGLPRAIVTPSHLPGDPDLGPSWTYVASGEEQSVRAVATCHFREGADCGPESKHDAEELKLALPAAPRDMIFAKDALWITLPDLSAIARIALPADGDALGAPFAVKDARDVQLFAVPVAEDMSPAPPVPEMDEYLSACGLGYELKVEELAATQVLASFSEPVSGLGVASPTRLRFYEDDDLLLMADATQPVIHALAIDGEQLRVRGTIATGAPIRDFALTPAVPRLAGSARSFTGSAKPVFGPDEVRYLYAIDDGDGSVMVHAFEGGASGVSSTPLRLPSTRKRVDRLELGAAATAIEIVDNRQLTDEDPEDDANGFVCDWAADKSVTDKGVASDSKAVKAADKARDAAQDAYDEAVAADKEERKEALDEAKAAYAEARAKYERSAGERSILDNVGPDQLRGVFAFITTVDGFLNVVDIHDLDVFCRGESACETDSKVVSEGKPLAVRRHTPRVAGLLPEQDIDISDPQAFAALPGCPQGTYPTERGVEGTDEPGDDVDAGMADAGMADGGMSDAGEPDAGEPDNDETDGPGNKDDVILCTTVDRWLGRRPSFEAVWEGRIFGSGGGRLQCADGTRPADGKCKGNDLVLLAPDGFDLCARGVEGQLDRAYRGDLVVFGGEPPSGAPADCALPEAGNEIKLHVKAAYRDKLELDDSPPDPEDDASPDSIVSIEDIIEKLSRCYPDFVAFEVRAADRFLVVPNGQSIVPHRLVTDEQDRCVEDPEQDERLRARAQPGVLFENIYASFQISKDADTDKPIEVKSQNTPVLARDLSPGGDESVPVSIRYFGLRGEVFVVDAAQGLRRFYMAPKFEADTSDYR